MGINGELYGTTYNTFSIGDRLATSHKVLQALNGYATPPLLQYNYLTNTWQFSNDGVTFTDMGSGGEEILNMDGGTPTTIYGGMPTIDCGGV